MARLLANPSAAARPSSPSHPPPSYDDGSSNNEGYIEQLERWYPPIAPSDYGEPSPSQQPSSLLHRRRRSGLGSTTAAAAPQFSSSRPSSSIGGPFHQPISRPRTATADHTSTSPSSLFGRTSPSPFRRWAPGRIAARSPTPHTSREPTTTSSASHIRVSFPDHRNSLRNPFDSSVEDLEYPDYTSSTSRRPSSLFMNQVTRTTSSSSNAGGGSGGGGGPFSRMLRRYSQGQGRTLSNATDASAQLARSTMDRSRERSNTAMSLSETSRPGTAPSTPGIEVPPSAALGSQGLAASASDAALPTSSASSVAAPAGTGPSPQAGIHRIRLVPHLEATRSLHFEPIERDVREGAVGVKIGRFTDRGSSTAAEDATAGLTSSGSQQALGAAPGNRGGAVPSSAGGGGRVDSARIAFKSKVVSRGHAEVWCEAGGKFFIKDTKSSSGTFLNHIRLSPPNIESRPYSIKDGDILQLGVDYQGGTEEIYRCVKIRVELNRGWQREANQFNVNALRQLRALQGSPLPAASAKSSSEGALASGSSLPTNRQSINTTDCCICLFSVTVCQALFIAPCSHVYHYKCIRPLLNSHHPGFSCPLCRTFADLEADVEEDEAWQVALMKEAGLEERRGSTTGADLATPSTELPPGSSMTASISEVDGYMAAGGGGSRSTPLPASGLRRLTASSNARPGTAVADEDPSSRNSTFDQFDTTAVFQSATSQELQGTRGDDDEEELLDESPYAARNGGNGSSDRISEEEDQSGLNLANLQQRRGSQPIAIGGHSNSRGADSLSTSGFSPLEESRTPVNQHVLSVLAELPPPATAAARRLASVQQSNAATDSSGNFLSAPNDDVEMESTGRPSEEGNAGFQTPAGSIDGHLRPNAINSADRALPPINANPGFSNSNRASPTTASGEGQEEELLRDDEDMNEVTSTTSSRPIVTSPNAPPTPSKTNNMAGKDGKSRGVVPQYPAGSNSTGSEYRALNSSTSRDSSIMGRRSQPGSPASTGNSGGGGKMRSFFKKATGGGSGSGGGSGWGTGSGSGTDAGAGGLN